MSKFFLFSIVFLCSFSIKTKAQNNVTLSGFVQETSDSAPLSYVSLVLKNANDSSFVMGTLSEENGTFELAHVSSGSYVLEASFIGFQVHKEAVYVGTLSNFLDLGSIKMQPMEANLGEVTISGTQEAVSGKMDKKTYSVADNISQSGASILQAMANMPGVTVEDGKVQLRGSDKVAVLMDGKQTALTGFGNQSSLDNIPASAIERIEIINNPGAKFDANGNAGIINIIYKKNKQEGFNGKIGLTAGVGALWEKRANLPTIRPQYQCTPKVNPSLSLNYRKKQTNVFFQGDYLYKEALNKNEFVERSYDDGSIVQQQTKRNRNTGIITTKTGVDWEIDAENQFTLSGLFSREKIIDRGDEPFFNADLTERFRLWQFLEDEIKTTVVGSASYQHKFKKAGQLLNLGFNYTFHRENEQYFFDNILPTFTGKDAFKLLSDEQVADVNLDYEQPLRYGRFEGGFKFRRRTIPTNMQFFPGLNSPLDTTAGGWADYSETIPAVYGTYIYETPKIEAEMGLRVEYVGLDYKVNPNHRTYKSDGYNYTQPFPNLRFAYKFNDRNKISLFYNRRVDRPNEVDIRIFPKYDDAEIIKVGNPQLRPQFTNNIELGYKNLLAKGSLFMSVYYRQENATITRIASTVPGSNLIYAIFQNANQSNSIGSELIFAQTVSQRYSFNVNLNVYQNRIEAFTVNNLYPLPNTFSAAAQDIISGNIKWNNTIHLSHNFDAQFSAIYLAPDVIPQGKIDSRFSLDVGLKKGIQNGKGELFLNATDLLNTMVVRTEIQGEGFNYTSANYYETQVIRVGYSQKF